MGLAMIPSIHLPADVNRYQWHADLHTHNSSRQTLVFVFCGQIHVTIRLTFDLLQGDLVAALLFNNPQDPFPVYFSQALEYGRLGIARACDYDLAFALSRLKHLTLLHPINANAQNLGDLTLKPRKCIIVLLNRPSTCFQTCSPSRAL